MKQRPWASVWRAPTAGGDVYLKANAPAGRHEPGLVAALARDWPDRVPPPLAVDEERGLLLTADHGTRLDQTPQAPDPVGVWERLLPRYAEVQIASAGVVERWLDLGVPDWRLERLPGLAEELIGARPDLDDDERVAMLELLPELEARCASLAGVGAAAALEHGDLHGGNVLVQGSRYWLFDWADASVSHPFCTVLVTLNTLVDAFDSEPGGRTVVRLRDAYLEPWTALAPAAVLRATFPTALWVAHVGRALDWDHMLRDASGPSAGEWQPHLARWLRDWRARHAWCRRSPWP